MRRNCVVGVVVMVGLGYLIGCTMQKEGPKAVATTTTPQPFLKIPLAGGTHFKITEGWIYSTEEREIHGHETHYAVDFAAERGTPVYAAADGFAMASYHLAYAGEWRGKRVGYGLGRFVQIWHPEAQLYTNYGHLDKIESTIPYHRPEHKGDGWDPVFIYQSVDAVMKGAKRVKQGDRIGYIGDTGCSWGYEETPTSRPDSKQFPSWDETHVHFEVYNRDATGKKASRYDPFGFYGQAASYQLLSEALASPRNGLWLLNNKGFPLFAKE